MQKRGETMSDKHRKILYLLSVVIFVLFSAFVGYYIGIPMVRFVREPERFRQWVDSSGLLGRGIFIAMVTLQVLIALIPGEPLEFAAGYAFGAVEGTALSMAGILIGSWLVFLLVRRFGMKMVEVFFHQDQIRHFQFLRDPDRCRVLALVLMTVPGTPKDLLSYFAGLTPISGKEWLVIVLIGRIPSLVTSTVSGAAAGNENYLLTGIMLAVTLVISIWGILYYRRLCRIHNSKTE